MLRSKIPREALHKLRKFNQELPLESWSQTVGRVLVSVYFFNLVVENLELYHFYQREWRGGLTRLPKNAPAYPWISLVLVLPSATATLFNVNVPLAAGLLTLDMLREDAVLLWQAAMMLLINGQRPNELMTKKMALLGCSALLFSGAMRDARAGGARNARAAAFAGMLDDGSTALTGRRASIGLLVGRLLLALLFVYVGTGQLTRIRHRADLWTHRVDPTDGHDNMWLVLELLLALPFAVGFKTKTVSLMLAATLWCEALTCWQFWSLGDAGPDRVAWTTGKRIHTRSHFVTNISCAGGLILLTGIGPGRYTVDRLLSKKAA